MQTYLPPDVAAEQARRLVELPELYNHACGAVHPTASRPEFDAFLAAVGRKD